MRRFFKSGGFKVFVVVLVFLFAGSVLSATTHDSASPFASAVSFVFGPVQRISAKAAREMSELSVKFKSASFYKKQITEFRQIASDVYVLSFPGDFEFTAGQVVAIDVVSEGVPRLYSIAA